MSLTDFEIGKIAEIVAGRVGQKLDAKALRHVIDSVVDAMHEQPGNPEITGGTCEVARSDTHEAEGPHSTLEMGQTTGLPGRTSAAHGNDGEAAMPPPQERQGASPPLPPDEEGVPVQGGLYEQIDKTGKTRVIIAAFGQDRPGVVAAITAILAELNCTLEDISQTLMQEFFSMIMVVNITNCSIDFTALRDRIKGTEAQLGMKVYVMHEDTFQYMHRI